MALLLFGELEKSRDRCQAYRKQGVTSLLKNAELQRALAYLSGDLPAAAYLKAAGESRVDQTNVHYLVGLTCLGQGQRTAARNHFRRAVETGAFYFDHYELA